MKFLFNLIGLALAGTLGYLAEPSLRFQLTGQRPSAVENARNTNVVLQMPGGAPQIDLASLSPEQLPQRILVNIEVKVSNDASGAIMNIPAGNRVKLIRIERGNAVVSPNDESFVGLVPITDTDLLQQIAANPPTLAPPPATPRVAPPVAVVPEPVTPPTGDSEEPPAMPTPPPVPEPAPAVAPEPIPTPAAPAGEPAPVAAAGTTDPVKAMQDSIKVAQIKEFAFDQVLEWKADADEVVDGETYQTGIASYKAETIFGVKTIQAKALIKAGKVQRWIWPKSGMEIK